MIIEKVSRSGMVLEHFQFPNGEIKIGRGYNNDLILHDVYVEQSHFSLNYDESSDGFWFEDLGSVNGTQVLRSKQNNHKQVPPNFVHSGDTLCVGKTYLKVQSRAQDVGPAVKISLWDKILTVSGSLWCVAIVCLALLVQEIVDQYIMDPRSNKLGSKSLESLNLLIIVIVYGVVWAFIARVQKSEPRLLVHVSLVAWCMLFVSLFAYIKPIIYFNFGLAKYASILEFLVLGIALFLLVWTSLYLATELKKLLRFLLALLVPVGLGLSLIVGIIQRPEFIPYPQYDSIVVSPVWQWRQGKTREQFVQQASTLYDKAITGIAADEDDQAQVPAQAQVQVLVQVLVQDLDPQ